MRKLIILMLVVLMASVSMGTTYPTVKYETTGSTDQATCGGTGQYYNGLDFPVPWENPAGAPSWFYVDLPETHNVDGWYTATAVAGTDDYGWQWKNLCYDYSVPFCVIGGPGSYLALSFKFQDGPITAATPKSLTQFGVQLGDQQEYIIARLQNSLDETIAEIQFDNTVLGSEVTRINGVSLGAGSMNWHWNSMRVDAELDLAASQVILTITRNDDDSVYSASAPLMAATIYDYAGLFWYGGNCNQYNIGNYWHTAGDHRLLGVYTPEPCTIVLLGLGGLLLRRRR